MKSERAPKNTLLSRGGGRRRGKSRANRTKGTNARGQRAHKPRPREGRGEGSGVRYRTHPLTTRSGGGGGGGVTRVSGGGAPSAAGMELPFEMRPKLAAKDRLCDTKISMKEPKSSDIALIGTLEGGGVETDSKPRAGWRIPYQAAALLGQSLWGQSPVTLGAENRRGGGVQNSMTHRGSGWSNWSSQRSCRVGFLRWFRWFSHDEKQKQNVGTNAPLENNTESASTHYGTHPGI